MRVAQQGGEPAPTARRVDGRVVRGTRLGPVPVGNQWMVLHRVGPDRAGPLDSARSAPTGRYQLRFHTSGDSSALYFVSTTYGGVAYFTAPLRTPSVSGDDATITVFDTTSGPVAIKVGGRHLIIGAPRASGRRPVGEVYDLQNDSTVTLVARDSVSPVWMAHLPSGALAFQLNTNGDLGAGAIARRGTSVGLLAPISPGIRQLAFTYELPGDAFPLRVPAERATGVFEVLIEEPAARVTGAPMRDMAPVSTDGRIFRRFLAQDVPANAVIRVDMPVLLGPEREKVYVGVGGALVAAMIVALVLALRRSPRRHRRARPIAASRRDELLRDLAALDAAFARQGAADAPLRAEYEAQRAVLKAELAGVLAGGAPPP